MKTYTVQVFGQELRGTWQERAKFDYKEAAAYASQIVSQNPDQRITVWWQNWEAITYNRTDGVQYADSEVIASEFRYIAQAMINAQEA